MNAVGKTILIVLGVAATAGIAYGATKLVTIKRDTGMMDMVLTGRLHSVSFSKIVVKIKVLIKNPTATALKFRFPFVTLKYKDNPIGSSDVVNKIITLPAFSQKDITEKEPITIEIYLSRTGALAADLFKILQTAQGSVTVQAVTTTYLMLDEKHGKLYTLPVTDIKL